jgi:hypothetical protein
VTAQTFANLKKLALVAPALPREVPSYSPQAKFYEAARKSVPVLVDELERVKAELAEVKK